METNFFLNPTSRLLQWAVGLTFLLGMFWLYSTYMQRYVGASDYYGYYSEALLLKSGKVHMKTGLNPRAYPCIAPLSYFVRDGKVVPKYPPGYPFLLALGSFFNLEFFVNPLVGVLTVVIMFLVLLKITDKKMAVLFSVLWAFSPIVVYGSTYVMSDLAATLFILLAFYFFIREKPGVSGIFTGLSLAVRPTNLLFLLLLGPGLLKKRQGLRFGSHFIIPTSLYGIFNWITYGAPWRFGYGNILNDFSLPVFFPHLLFYLKEITVQFTPLLVILALVALGKKAKDSWFYGSWVLIFLIFYCFWKSGGDVWWWTRFLLPSFPALFILAALGLKWIFTVAAGKGKILHRYGTALLSLVTVGMVIYFVNFGNHRGLYRTDKGLEYYDMSQKVAALVPPGSLVGAFELSGPLRLYTKLESFCWHSGDAVPLVRNKLKKKIPIYLVVERWNWDLYYVKQLLTQFSYEIIASSDTRVYSLVRKNHWLVRIIRYKRFKNAEPKKDKNVLLVPSFGARPIFSKG
jgi:hypothetical protein